MAKQRMGELLVRAGLITESDLRVALAQQKQHGGRLGEHLVRVNLVTDEQIGRALALQLGLPFNDLSRQAAPALTALLPEKVAARLQALPVSYDSATGVLSIAVADPTDDELATELARITNRNVALQVTTGELIRRGIERAYFGVEVRDEGTSEFELVDIHGQGKKVKVSSQGERRASPAVLEDELPEIGTSELMPIGDELDAPLAMTFKPAARPASPAPASKTAPDPGAAEEALRMIWALADLLVERGYLSRADLMKRLREK